MLLTLVLLTGCAQLHDFHHSKGEVSHDINNPDRHPVPDTNQTTSAPSPSKGAPPSAEKQLPSSRKPLLLQETPAETALKFAQRFSNMTDEDQKEEITRLGKEKSELSRLQMALALGHPASRSRDVPRALALLEEKILDDNLRNLADLLKSLLDDQQRSEDLQQQSAQLAKEAQRRADALQKKLDDLMNLEKSMIRNRPK